MPSFRCQNPICTSYVKVRGHCETCQAAGKKETRHTFYDQHLRDPESKAFYNSAAWLRARASKLTATPWCERCHRIANTVHHTVPLKQLPDDARTQAAFLMSVCSSCHSKIEQEIKNNAPTVEHPHPDHR